MSPAVFPALVTALQLSVIDGAPPAYWDWQLSEPFDLSVRVEVLVLDADAFDAEAIGGLRARGVKPVCYISVGTWEPYRDDAADFPAAVLGRALEDWHDERYLDIRDREAVLPLIAARMDRCAARGFAAVEADNIDLHENDTGFDITAADVLAYLSQLAAHAHSAGLEIAQKNAPDLVPALVDTFDFAIVEQCFEYDFCTAYAPYLAAGKDVLAVEYESAGLDWDDICAQARAPGLHLLLKQEEVTAGGRACH